MAASTAAAAASAAAVYITGFDFMYKNKNWPLLDFYIHRFLYKGPLTGEWHTFEHSCW